MSASCPVVFEIHRFFNASIKAYTAVCYRVITDKNGIIYSSRVAPVKSLTLSRLELCGASLLARSTDKIRCTIDVCINNIYL